MAGSRACPGGGSKLLTSNQLIINTKLSCMIIQAAAPDYTSANLTIHTHTVYLCRRISVPEYLIIPDICIGFSQCWP